MKKITLIMLLVVLPAALFASPLVNARIIDPFSPLYDYMDILYSLNGLGKPNTNRPWSEGEARQIISGIEKNNQTGISLKLYEEALAIINEGQKWNLADDFGMNVSLDLSFEGYAQTNPDDFNQEELWVRGYASRKPFLKAVFEFSVGDNFWTISDIQYRYSRGSVDDIWLSYIDSGVAIKGSDGNYYIGSYVISDSDSAYSASDHFFSGYVNTNILPSTYNFDFIFPHRAIASVGGKNWNLSLNRDRMKIGDSHIGNLLVDDYNDYNDYMRLSFFSNLFRYDWYLMFLNTITGEHEIPNTESRIFMIHTLDFRMFNRMNLKVSENVMYQYSNFDFMFLNPAFIYHNLNNRSMFNAIAYAELTAQVINGLNVYGQFALDQARAPNEGDSQSDSSGWLLGAEFTVPVKDKGVLENYAEFIYTTPLLYRRDIVDFIKVSRYYHQGGENDGFYGHFPVFEFIGFQFGGDTEALKIGTKYTKPGLFSSELSALYLVHGETSIYTSHNMENNNNDDANLSGKTPTGNATKAFVLSAKGDLQLEPLFGWIGMSAQAEIDWLTIKSNAKNKNDLQASLSLTVSL